MGIATVANIPNTMGGPGMAFFNNKLETVSVAKVNSIGSNAFEGCNVLTTADFPNATSIGEDAFAYCKALTKLALGNTPPTVGSYAFKNYPTKRQLFFADTTTGALLSGDKLKKAQNKYKNDTNDGDGTDNLWYGWKISYILTTGISLNETTKKLDVSEEFTLVATISPTNATNKNVAWTSSDATIVSVDNNGKITGLKGGKATITATTDDGEHTATCEVTVEKNTALEDVDNQRVVVYPNPAKGAFTIKANDQYKLQISDISGKIITEKEITERTTVELPTGVYLLKFSNEKEASIVKKVIVK